MFFQKEKGRAKERGNNERRAITQADFCNTVINKVN